MRNTFSWEKNICCMGEKSTCTMFLSHIRLCLHNVTDNWPTNKMGSHLGRGEQCLKVWTIWQFDQQFWGRNQSWQTQAHSCQCRGLLQNEPVLLVCCKGWGMCCQASIWQRFGVGIRRRKHIKYCGEMKQLVYGLQPAVVEVYWTSEWGRAEQQGGLWCRDCLNSPQALNCASAATVYYLSAVHLNAAHSLALEHIESIFAISLRL